MDDRLVKRKFRCRDSWYMRKTWCEDGSYIPRNGSQNGVVQTGLSAFRRSRPH